MNACKANSPETWQSTTWTGPLSHPQALRATMEYHQTGWKLLSFMNLPGHKNIQNTIIYTHLVNFEANQYITRGTCSDKGARALIEAGFEYVCTTLTVWCSLENRSSRIGLKKCRRRGKGLLIVLTVRLNRKPTERGFRKWATNTSRQLGNDLKLPM